MGVHVLTHSQMATTGSPGKSAHNRPVTKLPTHPKRLLGVSAALLWPHSSTGPGFWGLWGPITCGKSDICGWIKLWHPAFDPGIHRSSLPGFTSHLWATDGWYKTGSLKWYQCSLGACFWVIAQKSSTLGFSPEAQEAQPCCACCHATRWSTT